MSNIIPIRLAYIKPDVEAVLDVASGRVSISIGSVATEMTHAELTGLRARLREWAQAGFIPPEPK